ncbi:TerB family tellurite resistance protein [Paracrocinitomix mangrovi]|uniref:TerB family tellurite resistance protein n=1 Tax=Paracrocinitomix mangrovi TaxID=2862509 RepID=UPI001C8EAC03|nr:TerB family tellurite resistance protein [Paracrocinitomix mangrovi]UKN02790.1 TerB family tellurite resistance protein [Paracrocinitomix mangrovi]
MTDQEKLYETLGELIYAVAMADGVIQKEEREALSQLLNRHSWAAEIKWSFDYEEANKSTVEETYNKVINYCHSYGPSPIYKESIAAMKTIAHASDGIDKNEDNIISSFSTDLIARFQKDIDRLG